MITKRIATFTATALLALGAQLAHAAEPAAAAPKASGLDTMNGTVVDAIEARNPNKVKGQPARPAKAKSTAPKASGMDTMNMTVFDAIEARNPNKVAPRASAPEQK